MKALLRLCVLVVVFLVSRSGWAQDSVRIAVAADFKPVMDKLTAAYARRHATQFAVSSGASGTLYARITAGESFDLFFSADRARAEQAERSGLALAGTRFTYAIGKLVLWTPGMAVTSDLKDTLGGQRIRTVAIVDPVDPVDPAIAPYGTAAGQVLRNLHLGRQFKLIHGEDAAQAFQFLSTGDADAGFVDRAQIREYERLNKRSLAAETLVIHPDLYSAIERQAILLKPGMNNGTARDFLHFVQSEEAQAVITAAGYESPSWTPPNCHACERNPHP